VLSRLLIALYSSPCSPGYDASLAEGFSVSLGRTLPADPYQMESILLAIPGALS